LAPELAHPASAASTTPVKHNRTIFFMLLDPR
jgi:hypothetical protein